MSLAVWTLLTLIPANLSSSNDNGNQDVVNPYCLCCKKLLTELHHETNTTSKYWNAMIFENI